MLLLLVDFTSQLSHRSSSYASQNCFVASQRTHTDTSATRPATLSLVLPDTGSLPILSNERPCIIQQQLLASAALLTRAVRVKPSGSQVDASASRLPIEVPKGCLSLSSVRQLGTPTERASREHMFAKLRICGTEDSHLLVMMRCPNGNCGLVDGCFIAFRAKVVPGTCRRAQAHHGCVYLHEGQARRRV